MRPPIPSAVRATFDVLQTSETVNLPAVLVAALDVPREPIQYAATELLLERASVPELLELLRRMPDLPASARDLTVRQTKALQQVFQYALHNGSSETRRIAMTAVRSAGMTAPLPHVLHLLRQRESPEWELAAETLCDIVDQMYDRWRQGSPASASDAREQVLRDLEQAVQQIAEPDAVDVLAASVMILGEPEHPVVKNVLWHGTPAVREAGHRLMKEATHPGILRFLTASLAERYPHPQVFVVVRDRCDPEFIAALLRSTANGLSGHQRRNLEQVDAIAWLAPPLEQLDTIPAPLQAALVLFVQATRLPREQKAAAFEWLLRHGTPTAKLAATDGLSLLDDGLAQDLVRENIDAEDPAVQAWATSQLRHCALPEAYALLAERLNSPHPEVQAAARRELASFNVNLVLANVNEWTADEAQRAGQLLLMIDPDAVARLRQELLHPARQKRIRTARAVLRLGLESQLTAAVCSLAVDSEPMVRRTAAEVLQHISDPQAMDALERLLDDDHPRVRDTAAAALGRSASVPLTV